MALPQARPSAYTFSERLRPFLKPGIRIKEMEGIPFVAIPTRTPALRANAYYFSHPEWAQNWLASVHRDAELKERWHAAAGSWDGRVVVDIGCGPGNLYANLGGKPAALIGVDVAIGSLRLAAEEGYIALLADAHALPLKSGIADVVALNATLHHCDDMRRVIAESARLVRPGGVLIIDHDPQLSAWDFDGLGELFWQLRNPVHRWMKLGRRSAAHNERHCAEATQIHHRPGDGITEQLLRWTLEPMWFDVNVYPHNLTIGREVLKGAMGPKPLKLRMAQRLSGIDPDSRSAALSLLCVAKRRRD